MAMRSRVGRNSPLWQVAQRVDAVEVVELIAVSSTHGVVHAFVWRYSLHVHHQPAPGAAFGALGSQCIGATTLATGTVGRRRVLFSDQIDVVQRRERRRATETLALVGALGEQIFAPNAGEPLDGRNLPRLYFFPLLKRAGLPRLRFHELRHSAATIALHEGVPLAEVSATLGHSSQRTSVGIYSHAFVGGSAFSASLSKVMKRRHNVSEV
jgi:hypothetical protein